MTKTDVFHHAITKDHTVLRNHRDGGSDVPRIRKIDVDTVNTNPDPNEGHKISVEAER